MSIRNLDWITPEIEEAYAYHKARIAALYAGEQPSEVIAIAGGWFGNFHGLRGTNDIDMLKDPDAWIDDVLSDMAEKAVAASDRVTFRPLVMELDPLGVHYIDAILGANVYFHNDQVWSDPLTCDLEELSMPDLSQSEVFQASLRLAKRAVEVSQGHFFVTTPVLSCPINIGINIFGQQLLEALISRPDAARHALRIINDVIAACIRAFSEVIPESIRRNFVAENRYTPPGFGEIDGCATQLVSARQYEEFFAPLDEELLDISPYGGLIHLCGASAQHIPVWREMKKLRSVQLNDRAAEDVELYFRGLRPDQILYVAQTETTPLKRILEITGGQRLIFQGVLEKPIRLCNYDA